jgi:hypothetical protein
MDIKNSIRSAFAGASAKVQDAAWFQQIKSKWEELDPQSRLYLSIAGMALVALLSLSGIASAVWSVQSLKRELADKHDLMNLIQTANDEMRRLRDLVPAAAQGGMEGEGGNWTAYFEAKAGPATVSKEALAVSEEKSGGSSDLGKESLFTLSLKKVSIRQVVRYAFQLENGQRPIKLRSLSIDTQQDPAGYMDATLAVSAFSLKE